MTTTDRMQEIIRLAAKGRRAEKRGETMAKVVGTLLGAVVVWLLRGWSLMLLLGILHNQWPQVPAWGYWVSVAVGALAHEVLGRRPVKSAEAS